MSATTFFTSRRRALGSVLPGLILCLAVTGVALALEGIEAHLFGRAWLEALVLAIVLGTAVRTAWSPGRASFAVSRSAPRPSWRSAVVLLGASLSLGTAACGGARTAHRHRRGGGSRHCRKLRHRPGPRAGPAPRHPRRLRQLDLWELGDRGGGPGDRRGWRRRRLVHSRSPPCSESSSCSPAPALCVPLLGLSPMQYGVLAGLTVYAVPQVLAATAPVAALSVQVGTLVKLVRVLMLGPVVLALSLGASRLRDRRTRPHRP